LCLWDIRTCRWWSRTVVPMSRALHPPPPVAPPRSLRPCQTRGVGRRSRTGPGNLRLIRRRGNGNRRDGKRF
jgi:hypothetical protein